MAECLDEHHEVPRAIQQMGAEQSSDMLQPTSRNLARAWQKNGSAMLLPTTLWLAACSTATSHWSQKCGLH
eukprot:6689839-Karenia_brevis.AAC.1